MAMETWYRLLSIGGIAVMLAAAWPHGSHAAGHEAATPMAVFDVTIKRGTAGEPGLRRYRKRWAGCEYFDRGPSRLVYIDMPPGDDYYTSQQPDYGFPGSQFGLNLRTGLAWLRVYLGPRAYVYAVDGAYEPVYFQLWMYRTKGHFTVTGGLEEGRLTVGDGDIRIGEGFPWHFASLAKGSTVSWRGCRRTDKRNIHIGILEGQGSRMENEN